MAPNLSKGVLGFLKVSCIGGADKVNNCESQLSYVHTYSAPGPFLVNHLNGSDFEGLLQRFLGHSVLMSSVCKG